MEIGRAVDTWKQWKVALTWVQKYSVLPSARELCCNLLLGLSSFSWSQGAAYTHDITSLLSNTPGEAYLSSFHIDHMIAWSKTQYEAQLGPDYTSHCIFITVDLLGAITHFYGAAYVLGSNDPNTIPDPMLSFRYSFLCFRSDSVSLWT